MGKKPTASLQIHLGGYAAAIRQRLTQFDNDSFGARLAQHDATLWGGDAARQASVRNRLGWLDSHRLDAGGLADIDRFVAAVHGTGLKRVVLLGMGGSSLAPEVFARSLGVRRGGLALDVLDNTDPDAVARVSEPEDLRRTLFLVSSKSGTTTETLSFYRHFHDRLQQQRVEQPGHHFAAITDPGTPLETLARETGFRHCFINPANVGGRYSALSYFGLVPAALLGIDVRALLGRATALDRRAQPAAARNPGLYLGAVLGELARQGRDKLTLWLSPTLASFGAWLEQLIAESTGKQGHGIVPVDAEVASTAYGDDRVFVVLRLAGEEAPVARNTMKKLVSAGHPLLAWDLADPLDLGAEFLRWEIATAAAGAVLGINPFDEPNVTEAKDSTRSLLDALERDGGFPADTPCCVAGDLALYKTGTTAATPAAALGQHFAGMSGGNYIALLAYLAGSPELDAGFARLRRLLGERCGCATTLGYGPRYLHSTGQLHKGGPASGRFLLFTADHTRDLPVPGAHYSFGQLQRAQALGDYQVLQRHGRPTLRVHLSGDPASALDELIGHVESALPHPRR